MDPRVQEFLDRTRQETEERRREDEEKKVEAARKEREETLIRAGLYEEVTECFEYNQFLPTLTYKGQIYKDGKKLFVYSQKKPLEVSDEEYAQIAAALEERNKWSEEDKKAKDAKTETKQPEETTFEIDGKPYLQASSGAKFLRGIAWTLWIGGVFASIAGSFVTVPGYYGSETKFVWTSFLTSLLTYLFEGGFVMCFAEALDNLQAIRDWMCGFKGLKEKKQ